MSDDEAQARTILVAWQRHGTLQTDVDEAFQKLERYRDFSNLDPEEMLGSDPEAKQQAANKMLDRVMSAFVDSLPTEVRELAIEQAGTLHSVGQAGPQGGDPADSDDEGIDARTCLVKLLRRQRHERLELTALTKQLNASLDVTDTMFALEIALIGFVPALNQIAPEMRAAATERAVQLVQLQSDPWQSAVSSASVFHGAPLVPVIELRSATDAVPLARALLAGGIAVMEITLRTAAGIDAIRAVVKQCPNVLVGAGTVLTTEQADEAIEAGAKFIVSPGFDLDLVQHAAWRSVPIYPGVATPTEVMAGLKAGLKLLKFFPAEVNGGVKALSAIGGPFAHTGVRFMPTGGVTAANLKSYLDLPIVQACGGTWMVKASLIEDGKWDEITRLAREALASVRGTEV